MPWLVWLLLFVTGCTTSSLALQGPVREVPPYDPDAFYYLCEPGDFGPFMIIDGQVWLLVVQPDGTILDKCAIPRRRPIVVGSPIELS